MTGEQLVFLTSGFANREILVGILLREARERAGVTQRAKMEGGLGISSFSQM
jgi:hypothetical protein